MCTAWTWMLTHPPCLMGGTWKQPPLWTFPLPNLCWQQSLRGVWCSLCLVQNHGCCTLHCKWLQGPGWCGQVLNSDAGLWRYLRSPHQGWERPPKLAQQACPHLLTTGGLPGQEIGYIPTSTTRSLSQHPLEPHAHGLRCPKFDCPSPWKKPLHSTLMQVLSRKTGYGTMRQWAAPSYSLTTLPHSAHTASTRVMLCTTVPTPTPITTSLLVASYPQDIKITVTTAPMQTCTSPTTATMKGMWMQ